MGLFDLFKKDRGYEIHSLEFCEVGKDGKRDTRPSSKHYTDSRYIMPVVKMTSRIDRTVKIKVRITEPSGKTHTYDFDAPLKPVENMSAQFPWWGSEKRDHFTAVGTWRFDILDEEDHVVISAPLEIVPLEDIWESMGWIHIVSNLEFRNINGKGEVIDDWNTGNFVEPKYMQMRCRCTCYSDVVRKVTYHVEIKNERTGKIKAFDHTVTLNPRDGSQWLQICGWGSDSGTSYAPGTHTYTLYYKNREMGRGRFEVVKSPKQRGWIEPLALVLHFYNTDEEVQQWVTYDCALHIYEGKIIEQKSFKANTYKRLLAGFQWTACRNASVRNGEDCALAGLCGSCGLSCLIRFMVNGNGRRECDRGGFHFFVGFVRSICQTGNPHTRTAQPDASIAFSLFTSVRDGGADAISVQAIV